MNRSGVVLVGFALLAGCGAEERVEVTPEGVLGEALSLETAGEEGYSALAYCDDVTTWDANWTNFENQVLTLVNQRRAAGASCGGVSKPAVAALALDTRLRCASRKHSKDMAVNNFFSHTGTGNTTPWARMASAGYTSYTNAGENIAAGQTTPASVVTGWMNSTGHCNNIMNGAFKKLGVGYYYRSGSTYGHYWTQDFGAP
ncbi:CAP domain-containing protein [Stigmatella sp. ncwal1]|uniref:CAP domain-containing protein n=1 Tax=Stigmatella ashevillensis TaxID=2995309 RepID=A0ABT5DME7_9BACT|nr:CAP domain-containing protein [Stigmatella ashevillena]MDC0714835.1 CAP domain-containing protein [Stigmatella ashevillena]